MVRYTVGVKVNSKEIVERKYEVLLSSYHEAPTGTYPKDKKR